MRHFQTTAAALAGGFLGAALLWIFQGHSFRLIPGEMSYADLSAVMLSAVSVLVTILGVVVAILAIWGYSHFKGIAEDSARGHVSSEMENGKLKEHLESTVTSFLQTSIDSGQLRALLEARVDNILISGPSQRANESAAREDEDDVDL